MCKGAVQIELKTKPCTYFPYQPRPANPKASSETRACAGLVLMAHT
jgi:hypothetical protein